MPETRYLIGALLALAGGAFSFYFYSVYKGKLADQQWWIPPFLRMTSDTCTSVIDSNYGRHFGIANAAVGTPFFLSYAMLLILAGMNMIPKVIPLYIGVITIIDLPSTLMKLYSQCLDKLYIYFLDHSVIVLEPRPNNFEEGSE